MKGKSKKPTVSVPAKPCLCGCRELVPDLPGASGYVNKSHQVKHWRSKKKGLSDENR